MEKLTNYTATRKSALLAFIALALLTIVAVSVPAGAVAKEAATKTDAQRIAEAKAWAAKTVKNYAPLKSNPNPKGLVPGVGLTKAYARTGPFLRLNEYARFLERARPIAVTESVKRERTSVIYKYYHKARAYAYSRTVIRRGLVKKAIEGERKERKEVAESEYSTKVAEAKTAYTVSRNKHQKFRKDEANKIRNRANKQGKAIQKKLRKTKKGKRAPLIKKFKQVQARRYALHTKNALRYQIKMAYTTSVRDQAISKANDELAAAIQTIEIAMAKKNDTNMAYVNARTGTEVSLATTWRQRALSALQKTPNKVVKKKTEK